MGVVGLHVLRLPLIKTGLALIHVRRLILSHELVWACVGLLNSVAVWLLVKIVVVWLLHVI